MTDFGFNNKEKEGPGKNGSLGASNSNYSPNSGFSQKNQNLEEELKINGFGLIEDSPITKSGPFNNANVTDVEKGMKNDSSFYVESSAPAVPCSSKVPFVSKILPLSHKSSQVVPTYNNDPTSAVLSIQYAPALDIFSNPPTPPEILIKSATITPEKKTSEFRITPGHNSPPVTVQPKDVESSIETGEDVCRICHDNPSRMTLISPCLCKGSMGKVHRTCLERWLGESAKTSCEICGHEYETERRPRYSGWRSVIAWIRHPLNPTDTRNFFFDLACFFVLTPLAGISAWLCVVGAQHYSYGPTTLHPEGEVNPYDKTHQTEKLRNRNIEASNATWTSIGLLTLTGTLLAAYYVWLFVAVRYHIQVWRDWQARNYVVTISPLNAEAVRVLREQREAEAYMRHESETADQQQHRQNPGTPETNLTPAAGNNNVTPGNNNNNNAIHGNETFTKSGNSAAQKISKQPSTRVFATFEEEDSDSRTLETEETKIEIGANCPGPSSSYVCSNKNNANSILRSTVIQIPYETICPSKIKENEEEVKQ